MESFGLVRGRLKPVGGWTTLAVSALLFAGLGGLVAGGEWRWLALAPIAATGLVALAALRRCQAAEDGLERSREDYRQLVDLPAQATWICNARGDFLFVSERWTEWTGTTAADWMSAIHPDDRSALVSAWNSALASGPLYDIEIRVRLRSGSYRWMRTRAFAQRDSTGEVVRWIGQTEDIHERRLAEEQLRHTAGLLEMIGSSTDSIIWAKDREGRMLYVNRALERLAGITLADVLGKTDAEWNPVAGEAEAFVAADRRVLDSGRADDVEEVFTGQGGTTRFYRSIRSPLRDRSGQVIGVVGVATDITERREAEARERLLARELDHRAKNLLAVVQSVVALTRASSIEEFKAAVEGRIQALGRAHSMLAASRWEGADLHRIVSEELAPYAGAAGGRVHLTGPPLVLKPAAAQSLALVVHELATNAAKYGALSLAGGRLEVDFELSASPATGTCLRLVWTERGGPPIAPRSDESRSGFGTRLIRSSIERQLGGRLELEWSPEGLIAIIDVPVERSVPVPPPSDGAGRPQGNGPALRRRTPRRAA